MRRWRTRILGMIAVCCLSAGCKQQMFLNKECFDNASELLPPASIENDYSLGNEPLTSGMKSPPTLNDPDRPARFITLHEAFAIALENGSVSDVGGFSGGINGNVNDILPSFQIQNSVLGFNSQSSDRVKALALNPAMAGANLEASLSRFDAQWVTAMNWSAVDNIQQGLASFTNGNTGSLSTALVKSMASGGTASLGFENNYRMLTNNPATALSPLYESRVNIGFEQPLWRDFGTDINQVIARFPTFNGTGAAAAAASYNARQNSGLALGVGNEGILISRVRVEQQRVEFERRIHNLLINVEAGYWKLYQQYGRLYSFEEVLRIAHRSWLTNHAKFKAGKIGPANYFPIRGQYEEFRGERMVSLGLVIEAERNLRGLMGLPTEDGTRLVPIDAPTLAPYQPNWDASVQMALMQKPELAIARENLRVAQFALVSQKNFLKPDLRAVGRLSPVGFGTRLDGNAVLPIDANTPASNFGRTDNALRSLASGDFADWNLGLTLSMPIGFRLEHAAVRLARLQLAQSYYVLQDAEQRTQRILAKNYAKVLEWYALIEARRAERKAYADSVEARFREFAIGRTDISDFLLDAQRRLAAAQVKEYEAIAEYNIALAAFEYSKGNILKHNNIVIAEAGLPMCAEVRAIDHEKERAKAILLRERPAPIRTPGRLTGQVSDLPIRLDMPDGVPMVAPSYPQAIGTNTPIGASQNVGAASEPLGGIVPAGLQAPPAARVGDNPPLGNPPSAPEAKFGPGVTVVEPGDAPLSFRPVPAAGPTGEATPPVVERPASSPSITANGWTNSPQPLRASPRSY